VNSTELLAIKRRVRQRDGMRCVRCGKPNAKAIEETGRSLHVHRIVRGSEYAEDGCLTLCVDCHVDDHRADPPKGGRPKSRNPKSVRVGFLADPQWVEQIREAADDLGMTLGSFIRTACEEKRRREHPGTAPPDD
jgi:hypothetical protein